MWRHGYEYMDVIAGQNAFYDMNAHLGASLANDLAHGTLQNLVTVFCRPDDVTAVIKSGM